MSCKCLQTIRENLNKDENFTDVELKTSIYLNFEAGTTIEKAGKLDFSCRLKNKKGGYNKKNSKESIAFTHCPFCGEKYD